MFLFYFFFYGMKENNIVKKGNPQTILEKTLGLAAKKRDGRTVVNTHTFIFGLNIHCMWLMVLLYFLCLILVWLEDVIIEEIFHTCLIHGKLDKRIYVS